MEFEEKNISSESRFRCMKLQKRPISKEPKPSIQGEHSSTSAPQPGRPLEANHAKGIIEKATSVFRKSASRFPSRKSIHPAIVTVSTPQSPTKDIGVIMYNNVISLTVFASAFFLSNSESIYDQKVVVTLQTGETLKATIKYFDAHNNVAALHTEKSSLKLFPLPRFTSRDELRRGNQVICIQIGSSGKYEEVNCTMRGVGKPGGCCGDNFHLEFDMEGPGIVMTHERNVIGFKLRRCVLRNVFHGVACYIMHSKYLERDMSPPAVVLPYFSDRIELDEHEVSRFMHELALLEADMKVEEDRAETSSSMVLKTEENEEDRAKTSSSTGKREKNEEDRVESSSGMSEKREKAMHASQRKPHMNIGTIGHQDHGKTTLTTAIIEVLAKEGKFRSHTFDETEKHHEGKKSRTTIALAHVEYETVKRHYAHLDCPGHAHYVKSMIKGTTQMDGCILVVSAPDGPMAQTREHILLARLIGVQSLVCFLNKVDAVDDPKKLVHVEKELRVLLNFYKFPGDEIPIIQGSALAALQGTDVEIGKNAILKLLEAVDKYIPDPVRHLDKPFLMPVDDVLSVQLPKGRGTVVTGRVEQGRIKVGEDIEILGIMEGSPVKTTVKAVRIFKDSLNCGQAGDSVGLLFRNLKRGAVVRGQVLSKPGILKTYTMFQAKVYVLRRNEGGLRNGFSSEYTPQLYLWTADVTVKVKLPDSYEMARPGEKIVAVFESIAPLVLKKGQKFVLRDAGRTVGAGVISKVIG